MAALGPRDVAWTCAMCGAGQGRLTEQEVVEARAQHAREHPDHVTLDLADDSDGECPEGTPSPLAPSGAKDVTYYPPLVDEGGHYLGQLAGSAAQGRVGMACQTTAADGQTPGLDGEALAACIPEDASFLEAVEILYDVLGGD